MHIEDHCNAAKLFLDDANEKVKADDLVGAGFAVCHAFSNVRELIYHICEKKDLADLEKVSAGENSGGPQP